MLRHRLPVVLAAIVLVPSAAIAFSLRKPDEYTATAKLLFRDAAFDQKLFGGSVLGPSGDPTREAATNVKLVSLDVITERAAGSLRDVGLTPADIRENVRIASEGQADVVAVNATDGRPAVAARLANSIARQYIVFRRDADRAKITGAIALVKRRLDALTPGERGGADGRSVDAQIAQLEVLASLQTGNAELVQPAAPPTERSSPKPFRDAALGVVAGLLLGLGLAMLLQRLDRRLRDGSDAEPIFQRPVLGTVPESRALQKAGDRLDLCEPEAEAFRALRTNLRYFAVDQEAHSLLLTSAASGEGKSTTARFLAATAAASGARVVLLEADLRRPTLRTLFRGLHDQGLTEVLTGRASLADVIQRVPVSRHGQPDSVTNMELIVAGAIPPNPTDLLASDRMREVITELEHLYDLVLIDTSPISIVPDAIPILRRASGVAVVVRSGRTTKNGARALRKQMTNLAVVPLGVIVNGASSAFGGGAYGYYEYGLGGAGGPQRTDAPAPLVPAAVGGSEASRDVVSRSERST